MDTTSGFDHSIVPNNCLETHLFLSLYRYVYIIENFVVSVIIYRSAVNCARSCLSRKSLGLFYSICQSRNIGLIQKNPNNGAWGYTFLKKPLGFLGLQLCPWKFHTKQTFTSGNPSKLCHTHWKFKDQKPRLMETPH